MSELERLFSTHRLNAYKNENEHFKNIALCGRVSPLLLTIEICFRNIIDDILSKRGDWLANPRACKLNDIQYIQESIAKEVRRYGLLSRHQLVSSLTLGFWCKVANNEKICADIFGTNACNLAEMELKNYDEQNFEFGLKDDKKYRVRNTQKARFIIECVHTIRNRAFHAENLLKTRTSKKNIFPRITTNIEMGNKIIRVGVMPQNIEKFLRDVLEILTKNLDSNIKQIINEAIRVGDKDAPTNVSAMLAQNT